MAEGGRFDPSALASAAARAGVGVEEAPAEEEVLAGGEEVREESASVREIAERQRAGEAEEVVEGAEGAEGAEALAGAEGVEIAEGEGEEEAVPVEIDLATLDALEEMGLYLGIDPETVPAELKPAYGLLVDSAERIADRVTDLARENANLKAEKEELVNTFQREPDRVLLTLFFTHPEVFQKVTELAAKANDDPEYKSVLLKDLRAELALREANRLTSVSRAETLERAANRITARTDNAARRFGMDAGLARQLVALAIEQNNKQPIPLDRVDQIVSEAAKKRGAQGRRPLKPTKTPARVAAAAGAPKGGLEGAGAAGARPAPDAKAVITGGAHGRVKGIIKNILRKQAQSG